MTDKVRPIVSTMTRRHFLAASAAAGAGWVLAGRAQAADAPAKLPLALGACRGPDSYAMLKKCGYDFAEGGTAALFVPDKPDAEFERKRAETAAAVLPVPACNGFFPADMKLVGPEPRHEAALAYATIILARAGKGGLKILVLGSGGARRVPEGFDAAKARGQFVGFCQKLGPLAEKAGVTIVLEPLNKGETNFLNTVAEGCGIVDEIGHPNVQLHADIFHMLREDESPASIVKAGARLRHCHIAEKKNRTPPGTDGDDFRGYFKALKTIGYQGRMSIEGKWSKELEKDLVRAKAEIEKQWASA